MSVTISNCDSICKSPTNTSKSKMLYSFSKSARFPNRRRILCDKFYESATISPSRTTSFGFGHKYDFTKQSSNSPPPNTYNLKDYFSKDIKKGFGFGQGRTEMLVTGPLMQTIRNKNPGPGTYNQQSQLSKSTFTLTGKAQRKDRQKLKIPGPGSYPVTFCISQTGTYFLSKYKNSGAMHFSKLQDRCKTSQNKVPGPGFYNTSKEDLSPNGRYATSKMHNCTTRKFGGFSGRGQIADRKNTPGPGNYRLPSQFGYYISKKQKKQEENKQNIENNDKKMVITEL